MTTTRFVLLLALLAFALHAPTWSPVVTWAHFGEDGPELEAAGRTLGIAHPTGYPVFLLLTRLVSLALPVPVSAVNVITLLGAVAAVVLAGLLGRSLARRAFPPAAAGLAGLTAGGFLATSLTLWRQASIGEVYTLHLALVAAVLALTFGPGRRNGLLVAYLLGLGLAHHLQTLPLLLVVLAHWILGGARIRWATLPVFLTPLSLYGVLLIRSRNDPVFDWGNPESLSGLWWALSGTPYQGNLLADGWETVGQRAGQALVQGPASQLGWGGAVLAAIGIAVLLQRAPREAVTLSLLWLGTTAVAAAYAIPDPGAYYLPAVLAAAVAAGVGGVSLFTVLTRVRGPRLIRVSAGAAAGAALVGTLGAQVHRVRPLADATADVSGYHYARQGIDVLEANALVVSHGDGRTFSLWYGASILDSRPDVAVLYDTLLEWDWYRDVVKRDHPTLRVPPPGTPLEARRRGLVEGNIDRRPVYVTALDPGFLDRFDVKRAGPLYRLSARPPTGSASSETTDRAAWRRPG